MMWPQRVLSFLAIKRKSELDFLANLMEILATEEKEVGGTEQAVEQEGGEGRDEGGRCLPA